MCGLFVACAILIGLIASSTKGEAVLLDAVIVGIKLEPVFGPSSLSKDIDVMDFAKYEEGDAFFGNRVLEQIPMNLRYQNRGRFFLGWRKVHEMRVILARRIEGCGPSNLKEVVNSVPDSVSRCLPVISIGNLNVRLPFAVSVVNPNIADGYLGPELLFGCFLHGTKCVAGHFGLNLCGIGGFFCCISRNSCIIHAVSHVAQLHEEQQGLPKPNQNQAESKEPGSVLSQPSRPSEFGIWVLGLVTLGGGFLLAYGLCWAGGLFRPFEKHSGRKDGDG
jgi:hypothetical protein